LPNIVVLVAGLLMLSVACQWLAWRLPLPALVLLSAVGIALGPGLGVVEPDALLGEAFPELVSLAVAIILFDGGLNLRLHELRETRNAVLRLVVIGAPLAWLLIALAAHYVAGLSWPVAVLFGGILVVTGPTTIMPLLRQARLRTRVGSVLKWEGIVNDPIGALFAVITFEYLTTPHLRESPVEGFVVFVLTILFLIGAGYAGARLVAFLFKRGYFPEFLKGPTLLTVIIVAYALGNMVQHEGGLITVTVIGMTLANSRLPSIDEVRRFKEYITLLLVSLLFIVLTATLTVDDLAALTWQAIAFIVVLMLVVRPLTVFAASFDTRLTFNEKAFVGWIAPRGVVCVAISGLFGPQLVEAGYADGARMVPLAFAVLFATVIVHSFSVAPLGRRLGLIAEKRNGVLIVGSNAWTRGLAETLKAREVPVMIVDHNWHRLRSARLAEIPVHYGELLSEITEHELELNRFSTLIAATDNFAYNSLVCSRFAHEFGRERVFQLPSDKGDENDPRAYALTVRGRTLVGEGARYDELMRRQRSGWKFYSTRLTEEFGFRDFLARHGSGFMAIALVSEHGTVQLFSGRSSPTPRAGDIVIGYGPGEDRDEPTPADAEAAAADDRGGVRA